MAEIYLTPIHNRTVPRKRILTEKEKSFILENASKMNINRMSVELGITYHAVETFVRDRNLQVCKARKSPVFIVKDYEADGLFNIDNYNPSTI